MVEEALKWRPSKMGPTVRPALIRPFLKVNLEARPRIDKLTAKAQKITIKLPWEITTIYSEAVKQSGHQSDDEEDEDDLEAQEASLERLKVFFYSLYPIYSSQARTPGSGRCHKADDARGVPTLFGLSTSIIFLSQRSVTLFLCPTFTFRH